MTLDDFMNDSDHPPVVSDHQPVVVSDEQPAASPPILGVASFAAAVVALILIVLLGRKRKSSGNALLLVGPSDSGKTAILSSLRYGQSLPTHSSIQVNSVLVTLPDAKAPLHVIDVPGHPRLRDQFRQFLPDTKLVAFVVDSNTISRNGPIVAEHLHQILHALTSLPPSQVPPNLLILAHKSDLLKSTAGSSSSAQLAINRVKTVLERELEKRRTSGTLGVESLGAEGEDNELGGLECTGGIFKFDNWEGGEIAFVGTLVPKSPTVPADPEKMSEDDGLEPLISWIQDSL